MNANRITSTVIELGVLLNFPFHLLIWRVCVRSCVRARLVYACILGFARSLCEEPGVRVPRNSCGATELDIKSNWARLFLLFTTHQAREEGIDVGVRLCCSFPRLLFICGRYVGRCLETNVASNVNTSFTRKVLT